VHTSLWVQALPSLQPVPFALLPPSTQVTAPVEHEVVPFLQGFGLVVHDCPAAQATHAPELLHTMSIPQLLPADF
jgi:hypothetical protein